MLVIKTEHLQSVIDAISNIQVVVRADCHAGRPLELLLSLTPETIVTKVDSRNSRQTRISSFRKI